MWDHESSRGERAKLGALTAAALRTCQTFAVELPII